MKGASRNLVTLFYAPRRFFQARAEDRGGILAATAFALALVPVSASIDWLWYALGWAFSPPAPPFDTWLRYMGLQLAANLVILPFEAFVVHGMLVAMNAARAPLAATYRVCAYSQVAVVCSVVPYIGGLLGLVGTLVLLVIGVRETHGTSTRSAIVVTALGWLRIIVVGIFGAWGVLTLLRHH